MSSAIPEQMISGDRAVPMMLDRKDELLSGLLDVRYLAGARRDSEAGSCRTEWDFSDKYSRVQCIKGLTARTLDCLLAHWYLLPGRRFHRFQVRMALAKVLRQWEISSRTLCRILNEPPRPSSYLDFDFAWRSLSARSSVGRYLDISSPWLFTLALLARCDISSATLISPEADALKDLLKAGTRVVPAPIHCQMNIGAADNLCFDTVTSLAWLERVEDDAALVREIWQRVKPGGTLLLSVSCASDAIEQYSHLPPSKPENPPGRRVFIRRLYDSLLLSERIFAVVGRPKRYVLYGEGRGGSHFGGSRDAVSSGTTPRWLGSVTVGRNWRSYSTIQELPGEGVIAMKFVKSGISDRSPDQFGYHLV